MQASEIVLMQIMCTYEGRSPPVAFLTAAWAWTIHHISEQIRMTARSAKEVIENTGAWEHRWKWTPSTAASGGSGSSNAGVPDNKKLQNELDAMRGQLKRFRQA